MAAPRESSELTGQSYRERALSRLTAHAGYHGIALEPAVAARALVVVLEVVVDALESRYSPQLDKAAAALTMHPADFVTKRFELPGHEGLQDG